MSSSPHQSVASQPDDVLQLIAELANQAFKMLQIDALSIKVAPLPDEWVPNGFVVTVQLPARSLSLGTYYPFFAGQRDGYWTNFVYGYLRGVLLHARGLRPALVLDITCQGDLGGEYGEPYRLVRVPEAVDQGLLVAQSDLLTEIRYDHVDEVMVTQGGAVVGPSMAMLRASRALGSCVRGGVVLDLFSGSGALGGAAVRGGAKRAISLDVMPWQEDGGAGASRLRVDLFDLAAVRLALDGLKAHAALLDPFDVDVLRCVPLLAVVLEYVPTALLHIGTTVRAEWNATCLASAQREVGTAHVQAVTLHGEGVLVCATKPYVLDRVVGAVRASAEPPRNYEAS